VFTHRQFYIEVSKVTLVTNIKAIWSKKKRQAKTHNIIYLEVLLD
jgi:hypothetical protein